MSIKDTNSRNISFDTREELGDKTDKLVVMIGKSATRDNGSSIQFKPQIYHRKDRGQNRSNYVYVIMISKVIRIHIGRIVKKGDGIGKIEVDLDMNKSIGEEILEVI